MPGPAGGSTGLEEVQGEKSGGPGTGLAEGSAGQDWISRKVSTNTKELDSNSPADSRNIHLALLE